MGQATMSRPITPVTQHQRPSNLVASTLRAVGHTASKIWRHLVPCEARNNRRRRQVLCVEGTGFHLWTVIGNGSCLPTELPWVSTRWREILFCFSGFGSHWSQTNNPTRLEDREHAINMINSGNRRSWLGDTLFGTVGRSSRLLNYSY